MKDFATVRAMVGGLKGVMVKLNDHPEHEHKWKSLPKCPFCGNKSCAGVFTKGGTDFFKCQHTSCSSGGAVLTEVSYIAMREGLSDVRPADGGASPAYRRLLELANCWEEPKPKAPERPRPSARPTPDDDEDLIRNCIEIIRGAGSASVSLLQRRLRLGYTRAARIMDELERRKIVGPSKGSEPRDILNLPEPEGKAEPAAATDEQPPEDVVAAAADAEVKEPAAYVDCDTQAQAGTNSVADAMAKAKEAAVPPVEEPPPPKPEPPPKVPGSHYDVLGVHAKATFEEIKKAYRKIASEKHPDVNKAANAHDEFVKIQEAYEILSDPSQRDRYDRARAASDPGPQAQADSDKPKLAPGLGPLREFFAQLPFSEQDDNDLWVRRGLETLTNTKMGFKSNPRSNQVLIEQLIDKWGWDEVVASGLCLAANRKKKQDRRTNSQFHGKGQTGKKPEKDRRDRNDKWTWGWNEPVLIPFVDEKGQLVKLRPHKGGAPAGTVAGRERLYIPRVVGEVAQEKFYRVVICEGEFKAVALWQQIGKGRIRPGEAYGVCALPGITYGKNVELREELEEWLKTVGAREVLIAFDDEDKSDKPLRQRFDAVRWAKYLAVVLRKRLGVFAKVTNLPKEWRNGKGKSDWDGALAQFFKAEHPTSNNQQPTSK